jgi:hypothetical protein
MTVSSAYSFVGSDSRCRAGVREPHQPFIQVYGGSTVVGPCQVH